MNYLPPLPEGPSFSLAGDFPVEDGLQDLLAHFIADPNERVVPKQILPPHILPAERIAVSKMVRLPDRVAYGYVRVRGAAMEPCFWYCRSGRSTAPGPRVLWADMIQRACRSLNVSAVSQTPFAIADDEARKSPFVLSSAAVLHDRVLRRAVIVPTGEIDRFLPHGVKWSPAEPIAN